MKQWYTPPRPLILSNEEARKQTNQLLVEFNTANPDDRITDYQGTALAWRIDMALQAAYHEGYLAGLENLGYRLEHRGGGEEESDA